jgi:hypothetical protein
MYTIYSEKPEKTYLRVREKVGFFVKRIGILKLLMPHGVLGSLLKLSMTYVLKEKPTCFVRGGFFF